MSLRVWAWLKTIVACAYLQEVYELEGVGAVAKEEVQAFVDVSDFEAVVCHAVLEQQLLEEQEGALVVYVLADLADNII
eukprot:1158623-Pelagomonas_calceolata.AAC.3